MLYSIPHYYDDPKETQQINLIENLDWNADTAMFLIIEKAKETILDFSKGTVKVFSMSSYVLATACYTIYFALI